VRSTTEALEAFDGITYEKGAALLAMVESWISPELFQKGVRAYLSEHRLGNASASDLFGALGHASGQDVAGVLGSFTEQTGVPAVEISSCRLEKGSPVLEVGASEYHPLGAAPGEKKTWQIPVCVHYAEGEGAGRTCVLSTKPSTRLTLPGAACPKFIHPNAGQAGYYRSTLTLSALTGLARLPIGTLAVRERVGVLLDAWALVESGAISAGDFLALADRFRGDPEQAVWQRIVESLEFLDDEVVSESERPALSAFTKRLLGKEARALGWEPKPKELDGDRLRRRLVLEALGRVGRDAATLGKAKALTERWLTEPTTVDGDAASVALPLTAMSGDAALFERFRTRLASARVPSERVLALTALSAFTDPALVRRALELMLEGTVKIQDQLYVFRGVFGRAATRGTAFEVVSEHIDQFVAKIPPFARGRLLPAVAHACSDADADKARGLLGPRLSTLEGADRGLAQALESTHRCAAFRDHHRAGLDAWLASFSKGSPRPP
jgi:alanyl aminopeptidase